MTLNNQEGATTDSGAFRSAPSGRDRPISRERLSSQEGVEWSGSRTPERVPRCWTRQVQVSWRALMNFSFISCLSS